MTSLSLHMTIWINYIMIKIFFPNNNLFERKYILDIVFNEFLGLNFHAEAGTKDYEIILPNNKKLIIKDTFFNHFQNDLEYLTKQNIPQSIKDLDIFAACFFMLTRWEEYVNKKRDIHNRYPATESLAYKEGFLDRPIVNKIIEDLKSKLLELDSSLVFKKRDFELVLTHDVDEVRFWKSKKQLIRIVVGDILKRRDIKLALSRLKEYYLVSKGKIKDPFDTFDWLINKSEAIGVKSRFYFMSGGVTEYDNRYNIKNVRTLIEKIKYRGHIIGIHPSYNAYNDFQQFKKEKETLESICKCNITEGREHYLRFEVPTTWQIWEDNGMEVDSTCGYADMEGFRCGTGNEFSVFNILTREKLKLKERPLIYMDDNRFKGNRIYNEELLLSNIRALISFAKKYNSIVTLLFHKNIFSTKDINYKDIYEKIIK